MSLKVVHAEELPNQTLYEIGTLHPHNYLLGNGLITSNCFNKSHSMNYSFISYLCAYLKANYTVEFFCALMSVRASTAQPKVWGQRAPGYVAEARKLGVNIHGPSLNASDVGFSIQDNEIFFGLGAIRDLGGGRAKHIISVRGDRKFSSVLDFLFRVDISKINTRVFEALVNAGAFDLMGYKRSELLAETQNLYMHVKSTYLALEREQEITHRQTLINELQPLYDRIRALKRIKRLKSERDLTVEEEIFLEEHAKFRMPRPLKAKQVAPAPEIKRYSQLPLELDDLITQAKFIGCYVLAHPAKLVYPDVVSIDALHQGQRAEIAGSVVESKKLRTRKGQDMAFIQLGDGTGFADLIIFPQVFAKLSHMPENWDIVKVYGRVESVEPSVKFLVQSIVTRSDA